MWPNLAMHNANSADGMPTWYACAVNPNDIMCDVHNTCGQVSWASLHIIDVPYYTYWPGECMCQPSKKELFHIIG